MTAGRTELLALQREPLQERVLGKQPNLVRGLLIRGGSPLRVAPDPKELIVTNSDDRKPYTYRESRNTLTRMTAIRLGPSRCELVVHPRDLLEDGGAVWDRKFRDALADSPKNLVVNLIAASSMDQRALWVLSASQEEAARRGVRMAVRPSNAGLRARFEEVGYGALLGVAA